MYLNELVTGVFAGRFQFTSLRRSVEQSGGRAIGPSSEGAGVCSFEFSHNGVASFAQKAADGVGHRTRSRAAASDGTERARLVCLCKYRPPFATLVYQFFRFITYYFVRVCDC